jgi:hypothetical protein
VGELEGWSGGWPGLQSYLRLCRLDEDRVGIVGTVCRERRRKRDISERPFEEVEYEESEVRGCAVCRDVEERFRIHEGVNEGALLYALA